MELAEFLRLAMAVAMTGLTIELFRLRDPRVLRTSQVTGSAAALLAMYWWVRTLGFDSSALSNYGRTTALIFTIAVWALVYTRRKLNGYH